MHWSSLGWASPRRMLWPWTVALRWPEVTEGRSGLGLGLAGLGLGLRLAGLWLGRWLREEGLGCRRASTLQHPGVHAHNLGLLRLLGCHLTVSHHSTKDLGLESAERLFWKGHRPRRSPLHRLKTTRGSLLLSITSSICWRNRCVPATCSTSFSRASFTGLVCWCLRCRT